MRLRILLLLLPLALAADSIRLEYVTLPQTTIQQRLESVPHTLADRKAQLVALFHDAGCEITEQRVPASKKAGNLICTLPGETENTIVVGGHFDFIDRGVGAVDDWSGAVLLPSLFEGLKTHPRHHRFVFIAFAAEESGLYGSSEYVGKLTRAQKQSIHAMVNLECLGTTPPKIWASRADKRLVSAYAAIAHSMNLQAVGSNVDGVGDDDSHPFRNAKIPVITIHSLTSETWPILHTRRDTVTAIHPDDYYNAYLLAAKFLTLLDTTMA